MRRILRQGPRPEKINVVGGPDSPTLPTVGKTQQPDSGGPEGSASARQAAAFVDGLLGGGAADFVVSPGSRSTPLVLALARDRRARVRVILDERSAAFFGLGLADRTHRPVGLVCTSGTAVANYLPAVVEAWQRRVPLLVLSADRPPELRDCGAGQTIDQVGIFGRFVRWAADASAPPGAEGERYLAGLAREGLRAALDPVPGPVHFNLPFREPFLPAAPRRGSGSPEPLARSAGPVSGIDWEAVRAEGPGWIAAGAANPADPAAWADGLFRLSDFLGWPVLCDVLNPGRHAPGAAERVVTQYEGLLSAEELPAPAPRAVLQVGPLPTAKSLRRWLDGFRGPRWQWSADPACLDPSRSGAAWLRGDPSGLGPLSGRFPDDSFRREWMLRERAARTRIEAWMGDLPDSFEGKVHWRISRAIPAAAQVFIANSQPVRDAERFWFAGRPRGPRVFSSRGASGIDGLVSTAAGLADGGPPTVAVLGDLAFLHDCGGLRAARDIRGSLTLVVIDNGGGRIFGQLPVAAEADVFETYFLTPQKVDPVLLCRAHGIEVVRSGPGNPLADLLGSPPEGARVVLAGTDPSADAALRREWRELFESPGSP